MTSPSDGIVQQMQQDFQALVTSETITKWGLLWSAEDSPTAVIPATLARHAYSHTFSRSLPTPCLGARDESDDLAAAPGPQGCAFIL
jgi:hypothetical protein